MTARRAVVIQHNPRIPLGNIAPVLRERGYDIDVVDPRDGSVAELDPLAGDIVIVLGGHEAAYETEKFPYLSDELRFLRDRLEGELPTFGICLGAQLMAGALGGQNYRGERPDVSYQRIELTEEGLASPLRALSGVRMLEWHGDHFTLPEGATLLATSETYPNEAFAVGDYGIGIQFHPEVTDEIHEWWIEDTESLLDELDIPVEWWRKQRAEHNPAMQVASRTVFSTWLDDVEARAERLARNADVHDGDREADAAGASGALTDAARRTS